MDDQAVRTVVSQINGFVMARLWFDFEVLEYDGAWLVIVGGIDPTVGPELKINFEDVFCFAGVMNWRTDTSRPCLTLLIGAAAHSFNLEYRVEQGNHLFRFAPEGYPESFGCVVAAKSISFSEVTGK